MTILLDVNGIQLVQFDDKRFEVHTPRDDGSFDVYSSYPKTMLGLDLALLDFKALVRELD